MIKEITVRTVLRLGRRAGKHLDIGIKEITVRTVLRRSWNKAVWNSL